MERRQLESFLAVAEASSFTRASSRLSIAQPSLSYAIRALERELGATLVERHCRGVRLTAAGEGLMTPAQRTLRVFSLASGQSGPSRTQGSDGSRSCPTRCGRSSRWCG